MRALIDTRWVAAQLSRSVARDALRRLFTAPRRSAATALVLAAMAGPAFGQGLAPAPGANEIRIGNTAPYTGPASAYGVIAKVITAYLDKINAEGGINGRKVNMISYDDAYEPTKTMAMTRKLVEEDNVLLTLGTIGTNTNAAIQPYLNSKKVPQLFALSGAAAWDQPHEFPWTIGFLPTYTAEAQIFAQYLLENHPRSKIAVLYQEDGMGKEYLKGLKDGLSGKMAIVAELHTRSRTPISMRRWPSSRPPAPTSSSSSPRRNSRSWRSSEPPNSVGGRYSSPPRSLIRTRP